MKRIFCLLLFVVYYNINSFAQPEKNNIEASVSKFFDGLSEMDANKLKAYTTDDFILLENGELWNMDTLVTKMNSRKNSGIKRVNTFQFISTGQNGNIAWISYHNTADISLSEKKQTVKWLESAVLKKEKGVWKIKMLHSTRVAPAKPN